MKKEHVRLRKTTTPDPDNPVWTEDDFRRARPASEVLPHLVEEYKRSRGRPKLENPKERVSLRLDQDVIEAYRAAGKGWQKRINETLARHKPRPHKKVA
jgi:uncharacterized protein (DUF4415 family)